jgi:hypothetical protein
MESGLGRFYFISCRFVSFVFISGNNTVEDTDTSGEMSAVAHSNTAAHCVGSWNVAERHFERGAHPPGSARRHAYSRKR